MPQIQAIETRYHGYRFRSRLEARWACFFDALGVRYDYEREGYNLGKAGLYLPDFWLPDHKYWVEIKPEEPTETEKLKMAALVRLTHVRTGFIFYESPRLPSSTDYPAAPASHSFSEDSGDWPYLWCECPSCGKVGIEFDGRSDRLPCKECYNCARVRLAEGGESSGCAKHGHVHSGGCLRTGGNLDKGYNYSSPRLMAAYERAMSARFEHGEAG